MTVAFGSKTSRRSAKFLSALGPHLLAGEFPTHVVRTNKIIPGLDRLVVTNVRVLGVQRRETAERGPKLEVHGSSIADCAICRSQFIVTDTSGNCTKLGQVPAHDVEFLTDALRNLAKASRPRSPLDATRSPCGGSSVSWGNPTSNGAWVDSDLIAGGMPAWQRAEHSATTFMHDLGFTDARVTKGSGDGGIDVLSATAVAQVKHQVNAVGRPAVQNIRGVAHDGRQPIMYSWSGYSPGALSFAEKAHVALFYVIDDKPVALSTAAKRLLAESSSQSPTVSPISLTTRRPPTQPGRY